MSIRRTLRQGISSQDGSAIVWLFGWMWALIVLAAFLVNVVFYVDAKIRLQGAVDRGVYAGASYLAHVMNQVAEKNWKIRKEYLDKKEELDRKSNSTEQRFKDRIAELRHNHAVWLEQIRVLLESGYRKAHSIAEDVVKKNLDYTPHLQVAKYWDGMYKNSDETMFKIIHDCDDGEECEYWSYISGAEVVGEDFDPDRYKDYSEHVRMYAFKDYSDFVALVSGVRAIFMPALFSVYLTDGDRGISVNAVAAAQPYGGSIEKMAFVEGENVEEAVESERGAQLRYHPAFIPVRMALWEIGKDTDVQH